MNLEVFKNSDPSGRMSKESFVIKNYKEEYDYITNYCDNNNILGIPFKEKVYLSVNEVDHYPVCKNLHCDNIVNFKNSTIGYYEYCSNKCVSSDPDIKKIKEEKSLKKYGTKSPAQSDQIKEKIIKTNQKKYGGNSPMSSVDVQKKSINTLMSNYGVDNPNKSEELLKKRIESFKNSSYKESFRRTSLKRYGVDHPWMIKDIHKKTIDFFYTDYKRRIESKISSDFIFIDFKRGVSTNLEFHCNTCDSNFEILTYQFYDRVNRNNSICTNCFPISENASISQIEIYNFIVSNYHGDVILDCKGILNQYEIDIYLPELKIGFEFNGVWWHSEKFKSKDYHLNKYRVSENNNVTLISIWEDEWNIKRDIVKSLILNKIGKTSNRIFARKCDIREVSYKESRTFLYNNHLQGDCKSSIRIGIYNNDDIVSLMTFSKLRLPISGKNGRDNKDIYELTRFCSILDTVVVGGASKVMRYFLKNYHPIRIETYSDNFISSGDLYNKLGFKYSHTSNPGYWYVIDGIRSHRFNWRKQKLVKLGYNKNKTEEEIMSELGRYRVYNAGNKKWIYNIGLPI